MEDNGLFFLFLVLVILICLLKSFFNEIQSSQDNESYFNVEKKEVFKKNVEQNPKQSIVPIPKQQIKKVIDTKTDKNTFLENQKFFTKE